MTSQTIRRVQPDRAELAALELERQSILRATPPDCAACAASLALWRFHGWTPDLETPCTDHTDALLLAYARRVPGAPERRRQATAVEADALSEDQAALRIARLCDRAASRRRTHGVADQRAMVLRLSAAELTSAVLDRYSAEPLERLEPARRLRALVRAARKDA